MVVNRSLMQILEHQSRDTVRDLGLGELDEELMRRQRHLANVGRTDDENRVAAILEHARCLPKDARHVTEVPPDHPTMLVVLCRDLAHYIVDRADPGRRRHLDAIAIAQWRPVSPYIGTSEKPVLIDTHSKDVAHPGHREEVRSNVIQGRDVRRRGKYAMHCGVCDGQVAGVSTHKPDLGSIDAQTRAVVIHHPRHST